MSGKFRLRSVPPPIPPGRTDRGGPAGRVPHASEPELSPSARRAARGRMLGALALLAWSVGLLLQLCREGEQAAESPALNVNRESASKTGPRGRF